MAYIKKADRVAIAPETSTVNAVTPKAEAPKIKVKRDWGKLVSLDIPEEAIRKYPDMAFAWVVRNEEKTLSYQNMGYTYPQLTNSEIKSPSFIGRDTTYIMKGDLILMMHPLDEEKDRLAYWQGICNQRMNHLERAEVDAKAKAVHPSSGYNNDESKIEMKDNL
jgi:hypothetical protein